MTRLEIIILIITIFVSVTLLSLFLDKVFKTKIEKKEEVKPQAEEKKEEPVVEKVEAIDTESCAMHSYFF